MMQGTTSAIWRMTVDKKISKSDWDIMERPDSIHNVSTKAIAQCSGVDWVLGFDGEFGIGFSATDAHKPTVNRNYKKIQFIESEIVQGQTYFCFLCDDELLRELFEQLVLDLLNFCIEHIELAKFPQAIVNRAYAWEELFSKNRGGLSKNAAIGLMAELQYLENQWLNKGHPLNTWTGPSGAAQDFVDGDKIVEIKVKTHSNNISISSLEQLDRELGMYVVAYNAILDDDGETVNDCVARLCDALGSKSDEFMDLITEAGFVRDKNFKSSILIENGDAYFVDKSIPMLQVGEISGLIAARYTVDLSVSASTKLTLEEMHERLYCK